MSDLIYQIMWNGAWWDISPNLYKEHPARIKRILYSSEAYEALQARVKELEKAAAPEYQDTCTDGGKCGAGGYCNDCGKEPSKDE